MCRWKSKGALLSQQVTPRLRPSLPCRLLSRPSRLQLVLAHSQGLRRDFYPWSEMPQEDAGCRGAKGRHFKEILKDLNMLQFNTVYYQRNKTNDGTRHVHSIMYKLFLLCSFNCFNTIRNEKKLPLPTEPEASWSSPRVSLWSKSLDVQAIKRGNRNTTTRWFSQLKVVDVTITTACDARLPANKILELPASTPDCIVPITIFVQLVEAPNSSFQRVRTFPVKPILCMAMKKLRA